MNIKANGFSLNVDLVDNSSTDKLIDILKQKSLVIEMKDYEHFEKVGDIGYDLPRNDEEITTGPGMSFFFREDI